MYSHSREVEFDCQCPIKQHFRSLDRRMVGSDWSSDGALMLLLTPPQAELIERPRFVMNCSCFSREELDP